LIPQLLVAGEYEPGGPQGRERAFLVVGRAKKSGTRRRCQVSLFVPDKKGRREDVLWGARDFRPAVLIYKEFLTAKSNKSLAQRRPVKAVVSSETERKKVVFIPENFFDLAVKFLLFFVNENC
jgi:hypothetical protein